MTPRNVTTAIGLAAILAGLWTISQAWAGQKRPFLLRFVPG